MLVHLGEKQYRFPSQELGELEDHTDLYLRGEWGELRGELERRGYLRLRQLHDREQVLKARTGKSQGNLSVARRTSFQPCCSTFRGPEMRSWTHQSRWRPESWTLGAAEAVFPSWKEGIPFLTTLTSSRCWRDHDLNNFSRNSSVERFSLSTTSG